MFPGLHKVFDEFCRYCLGVAARYTFRYSSYSCNSFANSNDLSLRGGYVVFINNCRCYLNDFTVSINKVFCSCCCSFHYYEYKTYVVVYILRRLFDFCSRYKEILENYGNISSRCFQDNQNNKILIIFSIQNIFINMRFFELQQRCLATV